MCVEHVTGVTCSTHIISIIPHHPMGRHCYNPHVIVFGPKKFREREQVVCLRSHTY